MSWLYLPELVEDCLQADCLAGEPSALLKSTSIANESCCNGSVTDTLNDSLSGMTCGVSTDVRGLDWLTLYLAGIPAKGSALPHLDATALKTFGRRCGESWQRLLPGTSLPRTSQGVQFTGRPKTLKQWTTKQRLSKCQRLTWVLTTFGNDIGYLHTPTTKANYGAESMQKWPSCRAFVQVFGEVNPFNQEWLMGWPIGWTDLEPLATDKFQRWLSAHGMNSQEPNP